LLSFSPINKDTSFISSANNEARFRGAEAARFCLTIDFECDLVRVDPGCVGGLLLLMPLSLFKVIGCCDSNECVTLLLLVAMIL